MMLQVGPLVNNTGATSMGEFKDRLGESCVYPKFGHMENTLIRVMSKALLDGFSSESASHAHDAL